MRGQGMAGLVLVCALGTMTAQAEGTSGSATASPEDAPPRPTEASAQDAARRLFEAIAKDDPQHAADVFFPRDAFVQVKAMQHPERYFDRLRARFDSDLHALHAAHPELAEARFVSLELGRRGGWVEVGEEGNRLPYWAARHTRLLYQFGAETRSLEVRVWITWEGRWYVIHLSEFQSGAAPKNH